MIKLSLKTVLLSAGAMLLAGAALADDGGNAAKFYDRDRLAATALQDEQAALDAAATALADAQAALDQTAQELAAVQAEIDGLAADDPLRAEKQAQADALQGLIDGELSDAVQAAQDAAGDAQAALDSETLAVAAQVDALTDDQVFAFNRSLNNAVASDLDVNLDAADLAAAIAGDYDKRQINALTKALEEEAKFLTRADKLEEKAAATGNDKLLEVAGKMRERAAERKDKFLAKIDRFQRPDDGLENEVEVEHEDDVSGRADAAREARLAAKEQRDAAREAANEQRDAARDVAKEQRDAAKDAAKEQREAAREAVKESREAAKEAAKEARDAAKEAAKEARDVAKEAAKEAAKQAARN